MVQLLTREEQKDSQLKMRRVGVARLWEEQWACKEVHVKLGGEGSECNTDG